MPLDELYDVRLADLGLCIEGSLAARVERLHRELRRAGLRFRPYVWLSTDFFVPDGFTGFAIPFYLADPRLIRIERREMLVVEGGGQDECLRLMRHETGHAIDNAYRIHRRKRWRELFGPFSSPYRATYTPNPLSKRFVHNLDDWYAQSHPSDDWAETFAVWLDPRSDWRRRYRGWPALAKLNYVDEVMREIAAKPPPVRTRAYYDPLSRSRLTLREVYRRKKAIYRPGPAPELDGPLLRVFGDPASSRRRPSAESFLRRHRDDITRRVAAITRQHPYLIDQVVSQLIYRCRLRRLRLTRGAAATLVDAAVLVTSLTSRFQRGSHPEFHR